jgi:hypothetical protein
MINYAKRNPNMAFNNANNWSYFARLALGADRAANQTYQLQACPAGTWWASDYGWVKLKVTDNGDGTKEVKGTYPWNDAGTKLDGHRNGGRVGEFTGIDNGRGQVHYSWTEWRKRDNQKKTNGAGTFVIQEQGRLLLGEWSRADEEDANVEVLGPGSSGGNVTKLQEGLNALGHNAGEPDGVFGGNTKNAVIAFQQSVGFTEESVDGIVGPMTLPKYNVALSAIDGGEFWINHGHTEPGGKWLLIQQKEDGTDAGRSDDWVQSVAAEGVRGSGGRLPYHDQIQASFGGHDVSAVQAFTGGAAGDAAKQIGAKAYATGNNVAFAGSTDLHTAAHEAAHVIQQRAGVSLKGGVGQVGDRYEQHADAVADLVVQGKSAEGLLDKFAGTGSSHSASTQRVVQKEDDPTSVVGDPALEHNAETVAGDVAHDSEEDLYFNAFNDEGNWDGVATVNMMTQVTSSAKGLRFDKRRCGSEVALTPYIIAGPTAVVSMASAVLGKLTVRIADLKKSGADEAVPGFDSKEQAINHAKTLLNVVAAIPAAIATKQLFINSLAALSEALYTVTVDDPDKGANARDVVDMSGEGGGATVFDLRSGEGWQSIKRLFAGILPGQRNVAYPLNLISKKGSDAHFVTAGADNSGDVYLHDSWPRTGDQMLWYPQSEKDIKEYFDSTDPERARTWEIAGSVKITV